jgi:hypothetical protein
MLQKNNLRDYCLTVTGVITQFENKPRNMNEIQEMLKEYIKQEAERNIDEYFKTTDGRETILLAMQKYRERRTR